MASTLCIQYQRVIHSVIQCIYLAWLQRICHVTMWMIVAPALSRGLDMFLGVYTNTGLEALFITAEVMVGGTMRTVEGSIKYQDLSKLTTLAMGKAAASTSHCVLTRTIDGSFPSVSSLPPSRMHLCNGWLSSWQTSSSKRQCILGYGQWVGADDYTRNQCSSDYSMNPRRVSRASLETLLTKVSY